MTSHQDTPRSAIRPEHATGGWQLTGDGFGRWLLIRNVGGAVATVYATTPTTCAWTVTGPNGRTLREASARDVVKAKTFADTWIRGHVDGHNSRSRSHPHPSTPAGEYGAGYRRAQ